MTDQTNKDLPPLPEPDDYMVWDQWGNGWYSTDKDDFNSKSDDYRFVVYGADKTRDYGRACAAEGIKYWKDKYEALAETSAPAAGSVPTRDSLFDGSDAHLLPSVLSDEEIDELLPAGMAPYTTLCGPREIRKFARTLLAQYGSPAIPERLRAYIEYRRSHEMFGLGDVIHGVNGEAFLCLSDLFELLPPAPQEGK